MGACSHILPDPRETCPHQVPAGAERCLWHNPTVPKHQPYVAEVFRHADAASGGRFAGAHLAGMRLLDTDLRGRDLRGADLRDAVLDGCDLGGADLAGANLRRASLRHARLQGARLTGADLTGANLTGADLREVDFGEAVVSGTALGGADLRGANLKGAHIHDFHWNRLTRFAGVRGLEAAGERAGDDSTQIFPAPLALGDQDVDSGERLAFERDPALERTRTFSAAPVLPPLPAAAAALPPPPRRRGAWLVPALAGALLVGAAWGGAVVLRQQDAVVAPAPGPDRSAEIAQLVRQHQADLDELAASQRRLGEVSDQLAQLRQAGSAGAAELERLRGQLADQDGELGRLRAADDRAAVLAAKVGGLEGLSADLARQSARQDHIARVLADGLERYKGEAERLAKSEGELRTRAAEADRDRNDAVKLRQEVAVLRQERDTLQGLYQRTGAELQSARRDIQRYLARVNASSLQGVLGDDAGGAMLAVKPGQPLALGGDYLVSLVVDRVAGQAGQVQVKLVVQRPAAAANPDTTVVLYDQAGRPLRRLSFSFPHVDGGPPFVSASASVACDRFPTQARILLVPGDATVAAK
ncbi:MAG: pentapeptide repeat-containing protein [Planctomycetes bacterium]|nr:pentapeptide repeat-containing protein [Planctomycetota bacterium]